jgi:hypothetical protein
MLDDWPGTRYTTTHACFGKPCEKDLVELSDNSGWKEGTFKMGDMQEHKYSNPNAWKAGALPHAKTEAIENIHQIVSRYYDANTQRFKHPTEVEHAAAESSDKAEKAAAMGAPYVVPESVLDDWTGQRFVNASFEQEKKKKKSLAQVARSSLIQIHSNIDSEAVVDENAELDLESLVDPLDPTLADTDTIMKRYEQEDAEKELNANKMAVGEDPKGGIDKISASQISHGTE